MFCSECGTNIPDGSGTCPNCNKIDQIREFEPSASNKDDVSISINKDITYPLIKIDKKGFSFLIIAMFLLNASFLFKSLILKITSKPLPIIWTPLSTILCLVSGTIFLLIYFNKTTALKFTFSNLKKTIISAILSAVLSIGFISIFALILSFLYKTVSSLALAGQGFITGVIISILYLLLLLVIQFFVLSTVLQLYYSMRFEISLFMYAKTYLKTLKSMFKRFSKFFLIDIVVTIVFILMLLLQPTIWSIIRSLQQYGFLVVYFNAIIWAAIFAFIVQIIFNFGERNIEDIDISDEGMHNSSFKASIIFLAIALLPIILLAITTFKAPTDPYDKIMLEINTHKANADSMLELGFSFGAVDEYDKALSKAYSLKAY